MGEKPLPTLVAEADRIIAEARRVAEAQRRQAEIKAQSRVDEPAPTIIKLGRR